MAPHAASPMAHGRSSIANRSSGGMMRPMFKSLPGWAGLIVMLFAAAFFLNAAAAHAAPVQVFPTRADPLPPPSVRFQEGVAAYDKGDFAKAFQIWLPLAQQADLAAMRNVALMLRKGEGTPRDPKRALWFYEEAGSKGFALAQVNAAFMHLEGDGVPKNLEAAAFWFHSAARAGSPIAQYNLAVMYERGTGVEKDLPKALGWYALAARSGSQPAIDRLAILVPSLDGPKAPQRTEAPVVNTLPAPLPSLSAEQPAPAAPAAPAIATAPAPQASTPEIPAPAVAEPAAPPAPPAPQPETNVPGQTVVPDQVPVAAEPLPPVFQNPEDDPSNRY